MTVYICIQIASALPGPCIKGLRSESPLSLGLTNSPLNLLLPAGFGLCKHLLFDLSLHP